MRINVHAGHTKQSGRAPGASGKKNGGFNESVLNRRVKTWLIRYLREAGHTVYDCTAEGYSANNNLYLIVNKCNRHKVDLDISLHFNAYNGKAHGVETEIYSGGSKAKKYASAVTNRLAKKVGFTNRGVKEMPYLYVLRHTNSPAMLIEICFCDSRQDYMLYKKFGGSRAIARCIADAIKGA
jgi:N-acetylmuramoyl-L-alanine amidase